MASAEDGPTAGPDATAWAIHRLGVALAAVDVGIARRLRLSPLEFAAVKHLLLSTDAVGPGAIARLVGVSSGSATELIDRLHRAGHVQRLPDAVDGRRRVVRLTPGTRQQVREAMQAASAGITALTATTDAVTARALTALLTDVSQELEQWARDARPTEGDTAR